MSYNFTQTRMGTVLPLLIGCTAPSPVETAEETTIIYDPALQKPKMDTVRRQVGTYSLKVSMTKIVRGSQTDRKNAIDDSKWVN